MEIEWLLVPVSFLIGTFPSALLIGRVVGHDPIEEGSGNPGATNMFRIAGKKAGIATLVVDVLKAFIPTLIGRAVDDTTFGVLCGCAAVLGHMYPVLRQSRGGKGVACFGGLTIGAWPILAAIGLAVWITSAKVSGRSFVGAMLGVPTILIGTMVVRRPWQEIAALAVVSAIIIARHRGNIRAALKQRRTASA